MSPVSRDCFDLVQINNRRGFLFCIWFLRPRETIEIGYCLQVLSKSMMTRTSKWIWSLVRLMLKWGNLHVWVKVWHWWDACMKQLGFGSKTENNDALRKLWLMWKKNTVRHKRLLSTVEVLALRIRDKRNKKKGKVPGCEDDLEKIAAMGREQKGLFCESDSDNNANSHSQNQRRMQNGAPRGYHPHPASDYYQNPAFRSAEAQSTLDARCKCKQMEPGVANG